MNDHRPENSAKKNSLDDYLNQYRSRIVRDLIWCIASPGIMQNFKVCHHPDEKTLLDWVVAAEDKLLKLDKAPLPLINYISQSKTNRLGEKFERFWSFWLNKCQQKKVVAANYPVQIKNRTLGAFDLLVDESQSTDPQPHSRFHQTITPRYLSHFELSVKFYLNTAHGSRMSDWYGADQTDRLDKKINRMVEHQLKLSQYPAAEKLLHQKRWKINKIYGVCKGRLFWNAFQRKTNLPDWINPQVELGFWCPVSQFHAVQKQRLLQWYVLDKNDWFSPLNERDVLDRVNLDEQELNQHFQQLNTAEQIAGYDPVYNRENVRGFIVPDEWLLKLQA